MMSWLKARKGCHHDPAADLHRDRAATTGLLSSRTPSRRARGIHDNDTPPTARRLANRAPLDGFRFSRAGGLSIVARARDCDGEWYGGVFEGTNVWASYQQPAALTPTRPPFHLVWSMCR